MNIREHSSTSFEKFPSGNKSRPLFLTMKGKLMDRYFFRKLDLFKLKFLRIYGYLYRTLVELMSLIFFQPNHSC